MFVSFSFRGEKNFTCDHAGCGKSFYTKQRLLVHNRTHTGDRPFECTHPGCDKSFTTAQNLANHQRIHTGRKLHIKGAFTNTHT